MSRFQGDLPERTFQFALCIVRIVARFPDGTLGWEIGRQLLRSGTSIGANIAEADGALTDADFTHTVNIARKEAAETLYWLRICAAESIVDNFDFSSATKEADELHRILATIVRKMQTNPK